MATTPSDLYGLAAYAELTNAEGETCQMVFYPELQSPTDRNQIIPPTAYVRAFGQNTGQRHWRTKRETDNYEYTVQPVGGRISRSDSKDPNIWNEDSDKALESIVSVIDVIGVSGDWQPAIAGKPVLFFLEVGRDDVAMVQKAKPSEGLHRRIQDIRKTMGLADYPKGLNPL